MKQYLLHLAYKFHENSMLKLCVRPIWRMYIKKQQKKQRAALHKYGIELISLVNKGSYNFGYTYWLDFGTLLGAYREKDFIAHDYDLDIAAFYEDHKKVYKALISFEFQLVKRFYAKNETTYALEETYRYKDVFLDVFYYHIENNTMYCNSFSPFPGAAIDPSKRADGLQVKKIILPYTGFKEIEFKGVKVVIPQFPDVHLMAHYGQNFMIPNKNFDYKKEATNIYYYGKDELVGMVDVFFV